jgi:hypothetical protein
MPSLLANLYFFSSLPLSKRSGFPRRQRQAAAIHYPESLGVATWLARPPGRAGSAAWLRVAGAARVVFGLRKKGLDLAKKFTSSRRVR